MAAKSSTPEQIAAGIREKAAQVARDTMLLARKNVTAATPVDTEHAASNWVLSVGRPYTSVCGSRESVSYAAQEQGDGEAMEFDGDDVERGRALYLRNNVFYLKFLNRGRSRQAPANFIIAALLARGGQPARHAPVGTRRAVRSMLHAMGRDIVAQVNRNRRR